MWTYRNIRMYKSRSEFEGWLFRWSFVVDIVGRMGREWSRLRRRITSVGTGEEGDATEVSDRLKRRFSSKKNSK